MKTRNKQAAIQLSVSIIVILILSIVIFTGGLYLVKQFFSFAEQTEATVSAQAKKEIENRLIQSGEPVSIPFNKVKLLIGESNAFGIGILNSYRDTETFGVEMSFSNAFDSINQQQVVEANKGFINNNWIFTKTAPIENLKRNEVKVVPLTVRVGSEISEGIATKRSTTYVFNVCVYPINTKGAPSGLCLQEPPIPRANIRNELHGESIGKIYVEIP